MTGFLSRTAQRLRHRLVPGALLREVRKRLLRVESRLEWNEVHVEALRETLGRIEARQLAGVASTDLAAHELRVFSQHGEDGILQRLTRSVPVPRRTFVEIGVESYEEANTRFLLVKDGWSGLVVDADRGHVERIRRSRLYGRHDLRAARAHVTAENVDALLAEHGVARELGLLSIDIDGMDWWVWRAIRSVTPALVVVEYNWRFGPDRAVTVPYDPAFERRAAHPSLLYFGASLSALARLGAEKGYDLVGCESHGVNAFFVRRDLRPAALPALEPAAAWRPGRGCEAHDAAGRRIELDRAQQRALACSLPLVDVDEVSPESERQPERQPARERREGARAAR